MEGYVHTPELYKVFQGCFRTGLRDNEFRLPTLPECIAAEARLHLTLPQGKSQAKAIKKKRKACKSKSLATLEVRNAMKTFTKKKVAAARAALVTDVDQPEVGTDAGSPVGTPPPPQRRVRSKRPAAEFTGVFAD